MSTIRIIGIDPGIVISGFCILDFYKSKTKLVAYGAIRPPKKNRLEKRLMHLHDEVSSIISKFHPTVMAMEDSFYSKNVKSAVTLGQARSVIMLSGAKSVCGNGSATKEQVQFMVTQILNLEKPPKPIDITDAMAVALCFVNNYQII